MPRLLYLLTGIATAIPVVWALGWAVWGAGTSPTEYLSLLGSLVLAASAAIGARRVAARMALVGAMAVWSFYLPSIVGVARIRLSDRSLTFRYSSGLLLIHRCRSMSQNKFQTFLI
jgi:hypothetical protein